MKTEAELLDALAKDPGTLVAFFHEGCKGGMFLMAKGLGSPELYDTFLNGMAKSIQALKDGTAGDIPGYREWVREHILGVPQGSPVTVQ